VHAQSDRDVTNPKQKITFKHETAAMLSYGLLGCGFLAGWNAFITAIDFFAAAFPVRQELRWPGHAFDDLSSALLVCVLFIDGILHNLAGKRVFACCSHHIPSNHPDSDWSDFSVPALCMERACPYALRLHALYTCDCGNASGECGRQQNDVICNPGMLRNQRPPSAAYAPAKHPTHPCNPAPCRLYACHA
jgi:hypothetical protein